MTDILFYLFLLGILLCLIAYLNPKSRGLTVILYLIGGLLIALPFALLIYFMTILP